MKKLFYLLILIALLSSCKAKPARIVERTEQEMLTRFDLVRHYEYQGHKYISFQYSPSAYKSFMGVVHDPNCPCYNK